jgi:hypothetical protein
MRTRRPREAAVPRSAFAGFRFPPDVIVLAVRWYLRFGLSYRDVEELLTERGVEVDHVTRLPVGAAVHAAVGRRRPPLSARRRPALVGGRDLREDRRAVAVCVSPSTSSARSSTCSCPCGATQPPHAGSSSKLSAQQGHPGRGGHRPRAGVPGRALGSLRQRPGIELTSTPTTGSSATTAGCRRALGRCVGSSRTAAPGS